MRAAASVRLPPLEQLVEQAVVAELVQPGEMRAKDGLLLGEVVLLLGELQAHRAELGLDRGELRLSLVPVLDHDLEAVVEGRDLPLRLVGGALELGQGGRLLGGDDDRRVRGSRRAGRQRAAGQYAAGQHAAGEQEGRKDGRSRSPAPAVPCGDVGCRAHGWYQALYRRDGPRLDQGRPDDRAAPGLRTHGGSLYRLVGRRYTAIPSWGTIRLVGDAGWSSPVARRAHNPKVAGSNPAPATKPSGAPVRAPYFLWPIVVADAPRASATYYAVTRRVRRGGAGGAARW